MWLLEKFTCWHFLLLLFILLFLITTQVRLGTLLQLLFLNNQSFPVFLKYECYPVSYINKFESWIKLRAFGLGLISTKSVDGMKVFLFAKSATTFIILWLQDGLVQVRFTTSKTKLYTQYNKLIILVASRAAKLTKILNLRKLPKHRKILNLGGDIAQYQVSLPEIKLFKFYWISLLSPKYFPLIVGQFTFQA